MMLMHFDYNDTVNQTAGCPKDFYDMNMDVCQDYQMQGNAEFVPRVIEDELAERWILQCKACESMHGENRNLPAWPEMNLE